MKFNVAREVFHQAIAAVSRATAARVVQPVLANIKMEAIGEGQLKLSATDLDFAIETWIPAEIQEAGATTMSAKKLSEIVSKLPSASVSVVVDNKTQMAHIECQSSKFDVRTLSAEEFPLIKQIDDTQFIDVALKSLARAIQQTVFAAASYEVNNVLGGVFFTLKDGNLEMAATDGSRLARRIEVLEVKATADEAVSAIIPAKALQEFLRLVSGHGEETVRLAIREGQISFRTPSLYVVSRLLDGQYPRYEQLIPKENDQVAFADKMILIASLERAAVMANERTNIVKMSFDKGSLSLMAQTPDVGDSQDNMAIRYEGEPMHIAFNYRYVLDALKVIESDDVRMELKTPLSPTLFKSSNSDDKADSGYLCLVMPVQVK